MPYVDYSEFATATGHVRRHGVCQAEHVPKAKVGNAIALIPSRPGRQRIQYDFLAPDNRAVNPRSVDLTAEELAARQPLPRAQNEEPAALTKGQLAALLARLDVVEAELRESQRDGV